MLRFRKVKLLAYSFCLFFNNNCLAGGWLQPKGESEFLFEIEQKELRTYYKDPYSANDTNTNHFEFEQYSLFFRHGLIEEATIGLEAKWNNYKSKLDKIPDQAENSILYKNTKNFNSYDKGLSRYIDSHYKRSENQLAEYKIFGQFEFWSNDYSIISLKPNIGGFFSDKPNMFGLSILYVKGFDLLSKHSYIDIELGADDIYDSPMVDRGNIDSLRLIFDLSFGIDFTEKQSFLVQSFNHTDPVEYFETSAEFANIAKVSWIYKFNKFVSWQNGYSTNVSNRDKYVVNSAISTIWLRF